jgi:hypothetical protein
MHRKTRSLTTTLILRLKLEGFNGFYLQGCQYSNHYVLQPTVIEGSLINDQLREDLFPRIKYFEETEVLEMVAGDEFTDFVVANGGNIAIWKG